jgi:phage-related minor tail protein
MAGRIQGITVEIGGDTTKLQTALNEVNTEIRNTQSQLRDADKLLKLDSGNTELLACHNRYAHLFSGVQER